MNTPSVMGSPFSPGAGGASIGRIWIPARERSRSRLRASCASLSSGMSALRLTISEVSAMTVSPGKTRFSQFPSQPGCNQEYTSGLQQGLNDEVAAVVAQAEALVLQQPTEGAF